MRVKKVASKIVRLPIMLALAAVLVLPAVVSVAAQGNSASVEEDLTVGNINQEGELQFDEPTEEITADEEEPVVPEEEPEEEAPEAPVTEEDEEVVTPPEEEEDTEEDEDPMTDPVEDLARYRAFAEAEHPDSEIIAVKFVWKHGVKTAKFEFADGYRVFISIRDGSTLKVVDEDDKVKRCQKRALSNRRYYRWYKKYQNYHEFWRAYQQDRQEALEGLEDGAEVEGTMTGEVERESRRRRGDRDDHRSSRKHHHKYEHSYRRR